MAWRGGWVAAQKDVVEIWDSAGMAPAEFAGIQGMLWAKNLSQGWLQGLHPKLEGGSCVLLEKNVVKRIKKQKPPKKQNLMKRFLLIFKQVSATLQRKKATFTENALNKPPDMLHFRNEGG